MRYLFLFIFLSFVPLAKGQVNDIDDRNEYLDSLYSLCRDLFENHPDSTIKIGQEIILKSRNKNDYYLSLGLYCVGLGHSQIDDIKSAILYFDSAQAIQLENNYYHALTQNYISHSGLYYDLILVHQNNNNVELMNQTAKTGIKYCERAVSQAKKLNDSTYIAQGYGNMAAFYYYIYEYENAKKYFLKAIEYFDGVKEEKEYLKYDILAGLSVVYEYLGDPEGSIKTQLEVRDYYVEKKMYSRWIQQNLNLAHDYVNMKDFKSALFYMEEAEDLMSRISVFSFLFDAHFRLAEIYELMGDKDKALVHLKGAINQMNKSVNQDYKTAELEVRYEMAMNREKLEHEKAKNLENELALTKSRNEKDRLRLIVILSLILAIGATVFAIWRFRIMRVLERHKEQLHRQQLNKIRNEQELRALEAMLEGEEKERMRMSEELHDNLGSQLVGLKLQFGKLKRDVPEEKVDKYKAFDIQLEKAISESRAISKNLSTTLLTKFGLTSAIEDLLEHIKDVNDFKVSFIHKNVKRYESQTEVHLYRILQELLNNVVKHAEASMVHISLFDENEELTLIVDDDGLGFDPNVMTRGIGLQNIRRRVGKLNGKIEIHSSPGKGTIVRVVVKTVGKKYK